MDKNKLLMALLLLLARAAALARIAWITSPACQQLIAAFNRDGEQLFFPSAAGLDAGGR